MDRPGGGKAPGRVRLPAADRRETILLAATDVFAQAGYRAAKVCDVAARIGVTEPVIFQNFGSKAALFAADDGAGDAAGDGGGEGPLRVTDAHMNLALDQLLDTRNQLTRLLLGGQTPSPSE